MSSRIYTATDDFSIELNGKEASFSLSLTHSDESLNWFFKQYMDAITALVKISLKKFNHHKAKNNWHDNPRKLSLPNLFIELQDEVNELINYTDDRNFDEELGDILNYLIILKDVKTFNNKRKAE